MHVKAFIVNVNKHLKPFLLEQHVNIVNTVTLQSFWFIFRVQTKNYDDADGVYTKTNISYHRDYDPV